MNWRGLVAVIVAAGVSVAIAASFIAAAISDTPISSESASVMSTMIGAAVGALATYLGTRSEPEPPEHSPANGGSGQQQRSAGGENP